VVLRGPKAISLCYVFGGIWGGCLGWLQPQNTTSYVPILPRNQEAELMGLYLFACQILSWLPPTVFTVMNESHVSMFYGLGSLSIYFLISTACLYKVGDYPSIVQGSNANDMPLQQEDGFHHEEVPSHPMTTSSTEMTTRIMSVGVHE
jgi:hypothetical protein